MATNKTSQPNRILILAACLVIGLCAGVIYLWSVFVTPLKAYFGWSTSQVALTGSFMMAGFSIGTFIGGRVLDTLLPRKAVLIGAILLGGGFILTGFIPASTPWLIYITYSIISGLGTGFCYNAALNLAGKWFPDKRGLATGLSNLAFGANLFVLAPFVRMMLGDGVTTGIGVRTTFIVIGIAFMLICVICSTVLVNPPIGWLPEGYTPPEAKKDITVSLTTGQALKTRQWWGLMIAMAFNPSLNVVINPLLFVLALAKGSTAEMATVAVMLIGILNALARLVGSWISDYIGLKPAYCIGAGLAAIGGIGMIFTSGIPFLCCMVAIGAAQGFPGGLFAAINIKTFGPKHAGLTYGTAMLGYAPIAVIIPIIAASLANAKGGVEAIAAGSYNLPFVICTVLVIVGTIGFLSITPLREKQIPEELLDDWKVSQSLSEPNAE